MARPRRDQLNWEVVARTYVHPLRVRILEAYSRGEDLSPSMLAKELDTPTGNVSYHVRNLLAEELVELVRTEPRRGAVEHYYRATSRLFGA